MTTKFQHFKVCTNMHHLLKGAFLECWLNFGQANLWLKTLQNNMGHVGKLKFVICYYIAMQLPFCVDKRSPSRSSLAQPTVVNNCLPSSSIVNRPVMTVPTATVVPTLTSITRPATAQQQQQHLTKLVPAPVNTASSLSNTSTSLIDVNITFSSLFSGDLWEAWFLQSSVSRSTVSLKVDHLSVVASLSGLWLSGLHCTRTPCTM